MPCGVSFRISRLCILNKIDIAKYTEFSFSNFTRNLKSTAPETKIIPLSAKTGEGFEEWLYYFSVSFASLPELGLNGRVVIVGLGDRLKGDDGAGCEVAERLLKAKHEDRIKVINAENAIENYLGVIKKFRPDTVVFIDAVDFGGIPGEVRVIKPGELRETTVSTHTFSLPVIIQQLQSETGAVCKILGIQPKTTAFSEKPSPEVEKTVSLLAETLLM